MTSDDAQISAAIVAAQAGDQAQYRVLLQATARIAARLARATGVAPGDVDDVVQEVLLSLHQALPTYDPARPALPFIHAIAKRRAIDGLRRRGRHAAREVHDELAYETYEDGATRADDTVDMTQQAAQLRAAIAQLPPKQRQAVEMIGIDDRSLREGESLTGDTANAIKVNFFRAVRALREKLGGRDG